MRRRRLREAVGEDPQGLTLLAVQAFLAGLQERGLSDSRRHQAYRAVKTFVRWLVATGVLAEDPMAGLRMRQPKTLPHVPTDDEVRALIRACSAPPTGRRDRALILVIVDAGLRAREVIRLLVEHWNPSQRSLLVRGGKGRKDRVVFVSPTTGRAFREYLGLRPLVAPEDFLFVDSRNRPLSGAT